MFGCGGNHAVGWEQPTIGGFRGVARHTTCARRSSGVCVVGLTGPNGMGVGGEGGQGKAGAEGGAIATVAQ